MKSMFLSVGMAALAGVGCASNLKPCVSALDCGGGQVCSEGFVCQSALDAELGECAPADSVGGIRSVTVRGGQFRGDVGPFRSVHGDACDMAAFRDGGDLFINTVVRSVHGPAMTIVGVRGGLSRADLQPGRTVTYTGDNDVTVNSCAVWNDRDWGFDHQSDRVTISVTEATNGDWVYNYDAHFPGGDDALYGRYNEQNLTGTFRVAR